jgi:eukaryotic-like serine/threonine-protein kinase
MLSASMAGGRKKSTGPPLPRSVGRYQILSLLGEGGMGRVCLGRMHGPGGFERLVAIKLLHDHLSRDGAFVQMFLDEARISARIRHPNVVDVIEVGEESGNFYIAMEYISGETLARAANRLAKQKRRLPPELAAHLVSQACEGLHAAHELRSPAGDDLCVVHRDVSPENLIIGYDGLLRVTDFGVVKAADRALETSPGTWKGKAGYLTPELIEGQQIDRRADIYCLGIVLWEVSIGRPLFRAENPFASAEKIRKNEVPLPSEIYRDYPERLEEIVLRALSPDPTARQPTARALGEELRRYVAESGKSFTPVDVEHFMGNLFEDRLARRQELERRASLGPPPPNPTVRLPTSDLAPIVGVSILESREDQLWEGLSAFELSTPAPSRDEMEQPRARDDPLLDAMITAAPRSQPEMRPPEVKRSRAPAIAISVVVLLTLVAVLAAFYRQRKSEATIEVPSAESYQRVSVPETDPKGTKAVKKEKRKH